MILPAIFVGALFVVVFLRQPAESSREQWSLNGHAIGTTFTVKLVLPDGPHGTRAEVAAAIRRILDEVDRSMSTYRTDSEISRFNDFGTESFEASRSLLVVMEEALRVAELTGGAFDVTVGPLVDAWGFGPETPSKPPDAAAIDRLLEENGFRRVVVDPVNGTLRKDRAALRCDLSAIAKGFAVDRVAEGMGALGFDDFMVEIGGEVRAAGRNAHEEAWRIGVEKPQLVRGGVWNVVALANAAMATSGDYRNYYERDGVRISHLIDPRTGRPITHTLASVSVVHSSCMTADALATAISILGPDEGRELVEREHIAALFLIRNTDGGFDQWSSRAWPVENIEPQSSVAPGGDKR
jgi:thiamine biosynthesis lipoprotein